MVGRGPVANNLGPERTEKLRAQLGLKDGDAVFFVAGEPQAFVKFAGHGAHQDRRGTRPDRQGPFELCWIVDFPMYEWNEEEKKIDFSHNPFSMPNLPAEEFLALDAADRDKILALKAIQYDIVCNGVELSSGAIRNHRPDVMKKAFAIAGYDESVLEQKFGGMLHALSLGAPPHGGIAPGIDRIVMLLCGEENLREVVLFPMNQRAEDLMMGAPSGGDAQAIARTAHPRRQAGSGISGVLALLLHGLPIQPSFRCRRDRRSAQRRKRLQRTLRASFCIASAAGSGVVRSSTSSESRVAQPERARDLKGFALVAPPALDERRSPKSRSRPAQSFGARRQNARAPPRDPARAGSAARPCILNALTAAASSKAVPICASAAAMAGMFAERAASAARRARARSRSVRGVCILGRFAAATSAAASCAIRNKKGDKCQVMLRKRGRSRDG